MRLIKLMLVVGVLLAAVAAYALLVPFGPQVETFVDIPPGTGTLAIAEALRSAGVIRSTTAFEVLRVLESLKMGPHRSSLKAGEYRFKGAASAVEVYGRMRRGSVYTVELVIPEGFNIFDIAQAVDDAGLGTREAFLAAEMKPDAQVRRWSPGAQTVEGYLFPDTYRFSRHATTKEMVDAMVRRFGQEIAKLHVAPADVARTVTLASLVEKEVHLDAERPVVAGVFENRLAAGMPLQTDPTVVYASLLRGTWTGVIHESELRSDSAYNTYTHTGLPPGPICNPGMAALRAAVQPAKTKFLYFVADAAGATRFSETLAEHEANVSAYRAKKDR